MTIRWLHLSDTHFREDELWDRRATLRALIAKVRDLKENGLAPDMVFVTGDIAWSGKPKEYEQATRFFTELNKVLELDPKDRWFLVPGNHDVDRSRIKAAHRAITASLQDEVTVEELLLRDPDSLRSLSTRLEAYYNFAADFLGPARALQPDRPWRTDVREFDGVSIGILQLNSAWIAEGGKTDEANLLVGEAQVREALDATPDAFVRIALTHHPMRNLREFDANRVESLLAAKGGAAFLLRGHLHLNRTKMQSSPDGNFFEFAAGTLYTDENNWPRGFHLGEVDLDKGEGRIHLFRYSGEGRGFFVRDNLTYENAPGGICRIKLPSAYLLGGKNTKPTEAVSEDQRISFTARYRAAAASYHGHARFIGFPNQAARPNTSVSNLFVPLRMKTRGRIETESRRTAEVAQLLLDQSAARKSLIVVLGDPGSGKTTLSRFLVMLAAGAITMPGVEVVGEPLPLRVAFRDFVERRRENPNLSLLDYLEFQARTELSLALPKSFLSKAIQSGQAILLLDGLDEVGSPEQRVAMRDLVVGFCSSYQKVPVLVTSRIAGYDDAPLGFLTLPGFVRGESFVIAPFFQLVLEKFDDHDLRTFVNHWYSVQEPTDPVARDRGIADLMAALNADERVRELARTPILATLIAMIHRVEANLPSERAKLYELCVRMLIETWPAQAKRPFAEIDPGLQRAYLESLAFEIQLGRNGRPGQSVTIARADLIAALLSILQKRDFAGDPKEKVVRLIERWIDHLEKHSGILIQQSTGVYAFLHLSIMDYLAAQGMEREWDRDKVVKALASLTLAGWREVCLLAVGSHSEDAEFLDAVYKGVGEFGGVERWYVLLRYLQEEARFRPEQRETILDKFASWNLDHPGTFIHGSPISQILRFSVRHGQAVQRWIEDRIDHASDDELAAAVLIAMEIDSKAVSVRLLNRCDQPVVAGTLLEFWPGSKLAAWAASEIDAAGALIWSRRAPHCLALIRGVAAIGERSESLASASLLTLNERTLQSYAVGVRNLSRVANLSRPDGYGLPSCIMVNPGRLRLLTALHAPREPKSHRADVSTRSDRDFYLEFASDFAQDFARNFVSDFAFSTAFAFNFSVAPTVDFDYALVRAPTLEGDPHFDRAFTVDFSSAFSGAFVRAFARAAARAFGRGYSSDPATDFLSVFDDALALNFTDSASFPNGPMMSRDCANDDEARRAATSLLAAMTGESWIALATAAKSGNTDERREYLTFRIQNRWLFEIWSGIDQRLPENPSPAQLALYFALGWAQSTTTWAWPDSERWRTLFAAGPGEHWLVRSQWHLCKLTDDPASKVDDADLRAALRDGHGDESLPGYAARLSEVLGIDA